MVDDVLAVPDALDKHFRVHGAKPSETRMYLGHKVYLADGGKHFDAYRMELPEEDEWMRQGYFLAVWGVLVGKAVWGRPSYFKLNHNPELRNVNRSAARLNAAMADAEDYIRIGVQGGLLRNKSVIALPGIRQ